MPFSRSFVAGDTNYVGATLDDIVSHLNDWHWDTLQTIEELNECKKDVAESGRKIKDSADVIEFIENVIVDLRRFVEELGRLVRELPGSVEQRHLDIIDNLLELGRALEKYCLDFKRESLECRLVCEEMRPLLDHIYARPRSQAIDYRDLSNLSQQLKTFVGTRKRTLTIGVDDIDVFELKPNVFGLGINLNHLIKRVANWMNRKH